jgi:SAM-dependent methyltransferase
MMCRHCQAKLTLNFLDLGSAPPSNAYLSETALRAPEVWYPLHVLVCERCWLVQTDDHAGREALFAGDYAYFSSFSTSWLAHAKAYVEAMSARFPLDATSHVIEVASNDGYLLQFVKNNGIPCLGIEPTAGTASAARAKGIEVVEEFFGVALADRLASQGRKADLMAANNVLAHVPDINDFVSGFARLLKPEGVATFEFPHLLRLVEECQFDTVYHEHFSYLSFTAVEAVFQKNGLSIFDVEELSTHGGSLRVFAQRQDTGSRAPTPAIAKMRNKESEVGVASAAYYTGFQSRAEKIKDDLLAFLIDAKRAGKRVVGYGAAAKGNTLLNFAGVRPDLISWVIDRNPAKKDKFLPGSRIPIVGEDRLEMERPDYVLVMPWNLRLEISEQLNYVRRWSARLVTAVPRLEIA